MGSSWRTLDDIPADTRAELAAAMARAAELKRGKVLGWLGYGPEAATPTRQELVETSGTWAMRLHYELEFDDPVLNRSLSRYKAVDWWFRDPRLEAVVADIIGAYPSRS